MSADAVFDAIQRFRAAKACFAVVTVLRTEDATSTRPGDTTVIDARGAILGHLGGTCVQRARRRQSLARAGRATWSGCARPIAWWR